MKQLLKYLKLTIIVFAFAGFAGCGMDTDEDPSVATKAAEGDVADAAASTQFSIGSNITKNVGDAAFTVTPTGGEGNGAVTFDSSDTSVATIDTTGGLVTIVAAGTTTITATKAADGNVTEKTASFILTVNDPSKQTQDALNAGSDVAKEVGDANFTQTATGGSGTGAITYSSSTEAVATVNATTGEVTIVATEAGTTTITATKAGDDTYNPISDSYTVTVTVAAATTVCGVDCGISCD